VEVLLLAIGVAVGATAGWVLARRRADEVDDGAAGRAERVGEEPAPRRAGAGPAVTPTWTDVVDRLTLGVVVADAGGRIRYRNPAARVLAGTHIGLLVDDAVDQLLVGARQGEEATRTLELYGPPRVAVVVRIVPLPDGSTLASIEDVSERRRIDAVRTDFVANISHELKTPVGAIAALAEAIMDEPSPEVVQRVAERMVHEAHRVSRTIDDLMELSRIELGESPARDRVDLIEVISGAVARSRTFAEQRQITVQTLDLPAELVVTGDRRQLESALGNLVENAVKYSEPGASVQVRARVEGAWAELMVADHGFGIPPAEQARIFERFYRVDRARSRDTGGTGLGLSIVRHVATNHGGEVLVSSQEGEGSTFVLRVPLTSSRAPSASNEVRG
jgi:two-component system sensor histidine kinase SenX3